MKNRGASHGKYRLCGFLNLHPFFPAFVYPVFCKSDSNGNVHYYFEDGRESTIQAFYEIDLETFPELIIPPDLERHNYSPGSDTVYAYAVSPAHGVVWGNAADVIPDLKLILPTLQSRAQKKRIESFISSHRAEYYIKSTERFAQNARPSEWGGKALQAFTFAALLLASVYSILYIMAQKPAPPVPKEPDEIFVLPDDDIPMMYPPDEPPTEENSDSAQYQRLNITLSSPLIDCLANTFITGDPYSDDPDHHLAAADAVAVDSQSGKKYDIQELVDKLLLIPYQNGPQEIIFYGGLDTGGNWDGHCVTNVYEDQKLQLITDAYYDNGKLQSCKQMFTYVTTRQEQVWAVSSRVVHEDDSRSGETWTYYYDDIAQSFSYDDVTQEDVIFADEFDGLIESIGTGIEGYYNGNTSDGTFNDSTGHAYLVKYFKEDGTVRTLYVGQIENGLFEDHTGTAWEIGKKDIRQPKYSYFIGPFSKGYPGKDKDNWKYDLSQEDINALLDGYTFNCPLPGLLADTPEDLDSAS